MPHIIKYFLIVDFLYVRHRAALRYMMPRKCRASVGLGASWTPSGDAGLSNNFFRKGGRQR